MITAPRHENALVVVDIQRSQLTRELFPHTVGDVVYNAARLVEAARRAQWLVVYVRSSHLPGGGDEVHAPTDSGSRTTVRREGWDHLVPEFTPLPTEPVTIKRGWDAFYGSDLELQLRRHGVRRIVLSGISTNFGVEGTARAAYDRSFELVFAADAMTAADALSHEYTIRTVFPRIGQVRSTESIIAQTMGASPQDASTVAQETSARVTSAVVDFADGAGRQNSTSS